MATMKELMARATDLATRAGLSTPPASWAKGSKARVEEMIAIAERKLSSKAPRKSRRKYEVVDGATYVTIAQLAKDANISSKAVRAKLRKTFGVKGRWMIVEGSDEHRACVQALTSKGTTTH